LKGRAEDTTTARAQNLLGEYELFKTTSIFDSTATNPSWLREEPQRVKQLMPTS
jgi:hypothetical protein